jgi:hypothetical protein
MLNHDAVVPLYGTVEARHGLDALVERFELPYRVAGIEHDDILEGRGDGDVIRYDGTPALIDGNDSQIPLTEAQQGVERPRLDALTKSTAVPINLEGRQLRQSDNPRTLATPLLRV